MENNISIQFELIIINSINSIFPNLVKSDKLKLKVYMTVLLNVVMLLFNSTSDEITPDELFIQQFSQNNYKEAKWLLMQLLPYIGGKTKNITELKNILIEKEVPVNINKVEPKYKYSNIQYGRFFRNKNNFIEFEDIDSYMKHNFYLLINTIKTISHKLFPNWINIFPYSLKDYKNSPLFEETQMIYKSHNLHDWNPLDINISNSTINKISDETKYLDMNDIYNTISIELYNNIEPLKWMIYDINYDTFFVPLIVILNEIFDLRTCLRNNESDWEQLKDGYKAIFTNMLQNLFTYYYSGGIIIYNDKNLPNESIKMIIDAVISQFNSSNYLSKAESDGYIKDNFKTLKPEYFYNFVNDSIKKIKNTWYGFKLLNQEKNQFISCENFRHGGYTIKNVYNMAKSIVHISNRGKFIRLPGMWCSLTDDQKKSVLEKLNSTVNDWFDITGELKMIGMDKILSLDANYINNEIFNNVREKIITIIFESLIVRGVLTYLVVLPEITNETKSKSEILSHLSKNVFDTTENTFWNESYHFLTETPYKHLEKFFIDKVEHNIFSYYSTDMWYSASALNWIGQIGFCHRFINNRVIFITGATGAGKSTQVPKLCLYFLKAIDYNDFGRVVCSEPRRIATKKNADRVSLELGVPIDYDNNKNYYIQMKHKSTDSNSSHVNPSQPMLLKFETDGTLIVELKDPTLKKKINNTKKYDRNIYDVIMIDESHEHNVNMDLIMSFLQFPLSINNSVRMVVLSATMDEDEPRYRRFYRDINDNKKYPLDEWISNNNIDRINVDRRFHISPPDVTTKYNITDTYVPNADIKALVLDIIRQFDDGFILVFQSGTNEINKLVTNLNLILPSNVIAIPCHSKLHELQQKAIENIDKEIHNFRFDRSKNFNELTKLNEGTNQYDRVVIVATNIVEASVTIPNLKFIIDNGKNKVERYNYKLRSETLIEEDISEASRIQRRGRVGRTESGTVFYLYEKDKMKNNKRAYEIATKNLFLQLYKELRTSFDSKKIIDFDPNLRELEFTDNKLISTYFNENKFYSYKGDSSQYDYNNYEITNSHFVDGYDINTLSDHTGKFYIVHPEEIYLKRNINGDIISVNNSDVIFNGINDIESKKILSFWDILNDYLYLQRNGNDAIKTHVGLSITELLDKLDIDDHNLVRMIYFGMVLNCRDDIVKLCAMYNMISYDLAYLLIKEPRTEILQFKNVKHKVEINTYDITKTANKIGHFDNDSDYVLKLLKDFHRLLEDNDISRNYLSKEMFDTFKQNYKIELIKKYLNIKTELANDDDIERRSRLIESLNARLKSKLVLTDEKLSIIGNWCVNHSVHYKIMSQYISKYAKLNQMLSDNLSGNIKKSISDSQKYIINRGCNPIKLTLLLGYPFNVTKMILSQVNTKTLAIDNHYLSIYFPNIQNIYIADKSLIFDYVFKGKKYKVYKMKNFVEPMYLSRYVLYLKLNPEKNMINMLHHVTPEELKILSYVYRPSNVDKFNINIQNIEEYMTKKLKCSTPKCIYENKIAVNYIINYAETVKEVKTDLHEIYSDSLSKITKKLINEKK